MPGTIRPREGRCEARRRGAGTGGLPVGASDIREGGVPRSCGQRRCASRPARSLPRGCCVPVRAAGRERYGADADRPAVSGREGPGSRRACTRLRVLNTKAPRCRSSRGAHGVLHVACGLLRPDAATNQAAHPRGAGSHCPGPPRRRRVTPADVRPHRPGAPGG